VRYTTAAKDIHQYICDGMDGEGGGWCWVEWGMRGKLWIHTPWCLQWQMVLRIMSSTPSHSHCMQTLYMGERRLCIEQTISCMPSPTAQSSRDCQHCYIGLQVHKSYLRLICGSIIL